MAQTKLYKYVNDTNGTPINIRKKHTELSILIPIDKNNSDYLEVLEWVAEGNTIEEAH